MSLHPSHTEVTITSLAKRTDQSTPDGDDNATWLVTLQVGGYPNRPPIAVCDPFDAEQRAECRWYIEDFVCKTPGSSTRAKAAAKALESYGRSLLDQLKLRDLLKAEQHGNGSRKVTLSICEDRGAIAFLHSIHQIHWELLENPSFWDNEFDVSVQRLVSSQGGPKKDVQLGSRSRPSFTSTVGVNGLLVVARDLSMNSKRYEDISPYLALEVLAGIQQDLKDNGNCAPLNLEMVRPGSLLALQQHLERATFTHGKGFYDFVHFDLHGIVRSKSATAYLLFNDPDPSVDTTYKESVEDVGRLLSQHGVEFVVLNACESARVNAGEAANMAKVFVSHGVRNVVGMSFKITSSAAELFLRAFYHSLLLDDHTCLHAAYEARKILRNHPARLARLGIQRDLADDFVPVVYSGGPGLEIARIFVQGTRKSHRSSSFVLSPRTSVIREGGLVGRAFDLLRLEKQLVTQHKVHLTGRPGVGKSALLKQASSLWIQTSFVDLVLYVDYSKIRDLDGAIDALTSQFPVSRIQRIKIRLELRKLMSVSELDINRLRQLILGPCAKRRLIFIFDGLQAFYPKGFYAFPNRLSEGSALMLSLLIESLLHLNAPGYEIYHILVSRLDASTLPLTEESKQEMAQRNFSLPNLRLSDAIQLAQQTIHSSHPNISLSDKPLLSELELLVGVLDGNASAILQVMSEMPRPITSVEEFRRFFRSDLLQSNSSGTRQNVLQEIHELFCAVVDGSRALLLLMGSFWNQGVSFVTLMDFVITHKICEERLTGMVLIYAQGQGFLCIDSVMSKNVKVEDDFIITWIHPLLTIYGRQTAWEVSNAKQNPRFLNILPGVTAAQNGLGLLFSPWRAAGYGQRIAANLVLSVVNGLSDDSLLDKELLATQDDYMATFLRTVAYCDRFRIAGSASSGIGYPELHLSWASQAGNLGACLYLCIENPRIALDAWPLEYFQFHVAQIRIVGSPVQLARFAEMFERLLDRFLGMIDGKAIPSVYLLFALGVVTSLAAIYHTQVPIRDKRQRYVELASEIVAESEERFGPFKDPRILYQKGLAMRYHCVYLFSIGKIEEAIKLWQQMLEVDESIFEQDSNALGAQLSNVQLTVPPTGMSEIGRNSVEPLARLDDVPNNKMLQGYYKSRKSSFPRFIRLLVSLAEKGSDLNQSRQHRSILAQLGSDMEEIFKGAEMMGFRGINQDTRWWPEDFDFNRFASEANEPETIYAGLENAISSGDAAQVAENLKLLYLNALKNLDLDEAAEHMDSIVKNSATSSTPGVSSDNWDIQQESLKLFKSVMDASTDRSAGLMDIVQDNAMRQIALLKGRENSEEMVKMFELELDMLRKGQRSSPTELTNGQEQAKDNNEELENTLESSRRIIVKAIGDRKFAKSLPGIFSGLQQHMQRLQDAELSEDWESALEKLQAVEDFCRKPENEVFSNYHSADWYSATQAKFMFMRKSSSHRQQFTDTLCAKDYEGARRITQILEDELGPEFQAHTSKVVLKWKALVERVPLQCALQKMNDLKKHGKVQESIEAADVLIKIVEDGTFEYLDGEHLNEFLFHAKTTKALLRYYSVLKSSSYDEASDIIEELRALYSSNPNLTPADHAEQMQDLEEGVLFLMHGGGLVAANRAWDIDGYHQHTKGLQRLYKLQQQNPRMKRQIMPILRRRVLLTIEMCDLLFRLSRILIKMFLLRSAGRWLVLSITGVYNTTYRCRYPLAYILFLSTHVIFRGNPLGWKSAMCKITLLFISIYMFSRKWYILLWCWYLLPLALRASGIEAALRQYLLLRRTNRLRSEVLQEILRDLNAQAPDKEKTE